MNGDELLGLSYGFDFFQAPLAYPYHLMRLFHPIVGISIGDMENFRYNFSTGYWITSQLVRNDLSGLASVVL